MGQQQLLLIILGVIIVGIAIAAGLGLFSSNSDQSNKAAIINDLNNIASRAYQYKVRPRSMAGGEGSYLNFTIPSKYVSNENGTYSVSGTPNTDVTLVATSAQNTVNKITVIVNGAGRLSGWTYTGDFQ